MQHYYRSDNGETAITMYLGDVLDQLRQLPDESVQCVVTSPPYWGLRDYGTGTWEGGDPGCDHAGPPKSTQAGFNERYFGAPFAEDKQGELRTPYRDTCGKCGARRVDRQLGLESTPDEYVARMVEVFREVRRVLRRDGVCWLNLGDSYASANTGGPAQSEKTTMMGGRKLFDLPAQSLGGLKPKDLVGIPWRVALALQADGWWLRSDVIWSKPNPMPESVTDRPTRAHEYVFILAKSGDTTYWTHRDLPGTRTRPSGPDYRWTDNKTGEETADEPENWRTEKLPDGRNRWSRQNLWQGHDYFYDADAIREPHAAATVASVGAGKPNRRAYGKTGSQDDLGAVASGNFGATQAKHGQVRYLDPRGANKRTVWTVGTQPFPEAHFATFPPALIQPMILAGTSPQACEVCGAPWARVVEREAMEIRRSSRTEQMGEYGRTAASGTMTKSASATTTGWRPTCSCPNEGTAKCIVLDPFGGAGTTALVAQRLGRNSILIDLSEDYCAMARKRIAQEHDQQRLPLGVS